MLIGGVALFSLPVAQYPNITPPTVQVTTTYPGANARTVVDTVALPIEQQVNGVEGMLYMQSTSANDGTYTLTVTFEIGTDLDLAQVLVQNRVVAALAPLPQAGAAAGRHGQEAVDHDPAVRHADLARRPYDSLFLTNYATINLVNELARVPGVGNVKVLGAASTACASGSTRRSSRASA